MAPPQVPQTAKPVKKDRPGDHPRRDGAGIAGLELLADSLEFRRANDRWDVDDDLLGDRLLAQRLRRALVEGPFADIDRISQDLMDGAVAEQSTGAGAVATRVEPAGDRLDAFRPGHVVAEAAEPEYQLDELRLDGIDDEPLLDPRSAPFDFLRPVAERHGRAVVKALPGVLVHGAQDVLGVLPALVLVKHANQLAHHHLRRILAEFLRHRDDADAHFGELAHVHFEVE